MGHPLMHSVHCQSGAPHLHVLPEQRSRSCRGRRRPRRLNLQRLSLYGAGAFTLKLPVD